MAKSAIIALDMPLQLEWVSTQTALVEEACMARSQVPSVRIERQPHRDAVIRLREAYRRLRPVRALAPRAEPAQLPIAEAVPSFVQEGVA